ncbi:MAG: amidohydrolase family protein [Bacteroidales bacterium]|nr:amidohydrolase family protein [Bacteroidales bacterium]
MSRKLLTNALIVTGSSSFKGSLAIDGERISGVWPGEGLPFPGAEAIDLGGRILMAGMIDSHVHFREPGMTWKADIASESAAALEGGVTSFIDMPNTAPPTVSAEAIEDKLQRASSSSKANYGFHLGATNDNVPRIKEYLDTGLGERFGGIKVFMGSSTGNMLVDRDESLEEVFRIKGKPVLVHSEDEGLIKAGLESARQAFGDNIPFGCHPTIRSREACIRSTERALEKAVRLGTSLHILHVSTAEEVDMIREAKASNPHITAETSANYLWFSEEDYSRLLGKVKCNPAVKAASDREALRKALAEGIIDTLGSDHAPHLLSEKDRPYIQCPSGLPSVREQLPVLFTLAKECGIPPERIASACSERVAEIFKIEDRGRLAAGCYADLVVIDPDKEFTVKGEGYKCGWSPYEGTVLKGKVEMVWVNGRLAVNNSTLNIGTEQFQPQPLRFHPTAGQ